MPDAGLETADKENTMKHLAPILLMVLALPAVATAQNPTPHPHLVNDSRCLSWRWIGIKAAGTACPKPLSEDWKERLLFAQDPDDLPPALRDFCLYESSADVPVDDFPRVQEPDWRVEPSPDCVAVQAMAGTLAASAWEPLRRHFLEQAGRTPLPGASPSHVRLAFLDTSATREDGYLVPGSSLHGYTLTHLARELVCEAAAHPACAHDGCAAQITTQLALPIVRFDRHLSTNTVLDERRGGFVGTVGQLAAAVRREVAAWRRQGYGPRLILNLAVAWDGERFGGWEEDASLMPASVQAVYRAIEDAVCRGALVVAAAGNQSGDPRQSSGALLPAGWETRAAPGPRACAEKTARFADDELPVASLGRELARKVDPGLGLELPVADDPATLAVIAHREPLVYAAGGIDSTGAPLANAQAAGQPPRVAYADHAVAADPGLGRPTATYTGTSVAAAVVSAAAAVVWHYRPELERHRLMELLWEAGEELHPAADVYLGTQIPPVHRISVCRSLARACGPRSAHCPARVECPAWSRRHARLGLGSIQPVKIHDAAQFTWQDPQPRMAQRAPTHAAETGPQPEIIPCPTCGFGLTATGGCSVKPAYRLDLEIAKDGAWKGLTARYLSIGKAGLKLDWQLSPGEIAAIDCIDCGQHCGGSVSLLFESPELGTIKNPVLVTSP